MPRRISYEEFEKRRYWTRLKRTACKFPEGYWWLDEERNVCFSECNPTPKKKKKGA